MFLWLNTVAGLGFLWLQAMSSASIRTMWLEKERMRWFRKKEMLLVGYCELSNTRNIIIVLQFWIFLSCLLSNKLSPAHMGQRQGTHSGRVSSPLQDTHTMFTITDYNLRAVQNYTFLGWKEILNCHSVCKRVDGACLCICLSCDGYMTCPGYISCFHPVWGIV